MVSKADALTRRLTGPEVCFQAGFPENGVRHCEDRILARGAEGAHREPVPARAVSALRSRLHAVSILVSILLLSMFLESVEVETSWKRSLVF